MSIVWIYYEQIVNNSIKFGRNMLKLKINRLTADLYINSIISQVLQQLQSFILCPKRIIVLHEIRFAELIMQSEYK